MKQSEEIRERLEQLNAAEQEIRSQLGPAVFDYPFVFNHTVDLEVNLTKLTPAASSAIQNYNQQALAILTALNLNTYADISDQKQLFTALSHEIYLLRYLQALTLFPDYKLVRVLSALEQELLEADSRIPVPDRTLVLDLAEEIKLDQYGLLDAVETAKHEKKEYNLAVLLSTVTHDGDIWPILYEDFNEVTFYAMVDYFHSDNLKLLCQELVSTSSNFFTKEVYKNLKRGLGVRDAKANVSGYFKRILKEPFTEYPDPLKPLEAELEEVIKANLNLIPDLKQETKQTIHNEFLELILLHIREDNFLPFNYYQVQVKSAPEIDNKYYEKYSNLVESFLYYDDGTVSEVPVETYTIAIGQDAKEQVFAYVTNGIENPYYTLNDYLTDY